MKSPITLEHGRPRGLGFDEFQFSKKTTSCELMRCPNY